MADECSLLSKHTSMGTHTHRTIKFHEQLGFIIHHLESDKSCSRKTCLGKPSIALNPPSQ